MRFHTQTAGVSLTPQQPLNNLTRVAIQALAAVLGGTQSLHTDAYDEALAVPTEEAALLALRQQQVIAEETGVANTVDPLGGSWFVEALTNETERAVWRYLDEIDARGGMVEAVEAGYPQREIADAAYRYQREFEAGERVVVGVNRYVDAAEAARASRSSRSPTGSLARQLARLERTRRERDARPSTSALAGLRDTASRPESIGHQPDAALHPLRRGVRHARRAVRGPARGLRRVPRAGRHLNAGRPSVAEHHHRRRRHATTAASVTATALEELTTMATLTEEQRLLRDTVRALADEKIAPRAADIDRTAEFPWDVKELLAEHELFTLHFPERLGGLGGDLLTACLAIEQISRVCATSGLILAVQGLGALPILVAGTDEQQQRWIPDLAAGKTLIAFAITEAEAGSDAAAIRTRAVRDGDDYVISTAPSASSATARWPTS